MKLNTYEKSLVLEALKLSFHLKKRAIAKLERCTQPDDKVDHDIHLARVKAGQFSALFKKLGGKVYTEKVVKVEDKRGLR